MLVAEHTDCGRSKQQSGSVVGRQASPAGANYAQNVAVSDEEPTSSSLASTLDQRIYTRAYLGGALTARAAISEEEPIGPRLLNLRRRNSFVIAVVPFRQLICGLRAGAITG